MKNEVQALWYKPPPRIDWLIGRFHPPQHALFLRRKSSMIGRTTLVWSPKTKNTIMPWGNVELTALTLVRSVGHSATTTRRLDVQDDTLDVLWAPQLIAKYRSLGWLNSIILIEFNQGALVTDTGPPDTLQTEFSFFAKWNISSKKKPITKMKKTLWKSLTRSF